MPRPRQILPALFLLFALPVLSFLALQVPTGEIPDEVAHVIRMDSLRFGDIVGHRRPRLDGLGNSVPDSGVTARPALLLAGFSFVPGTPLPERKLTQERLDLLQAIPWGDPGFVSIPNTAVYPPLFYVPGAVAMQLARWSGYGPWHAIIAARLANALAYLAIGLAALLLATRLQGLIFAALLLPISLWIAASCSQDGLVIATAALAAALLTRGTTRAWAAAAIAIAAIAMSKPLYLPLAGLVFLLFPRPGLQLPRRAAAALLAAAPALAWYFVAKRYAVVPFVRGGPYPAGPNWPGPADQIFTTVDPAQQIQVFLHNPLLLLTLPVTTFETQAKWLSLELVGILGVLDIILPVALYGAWFAALLALLPGETLSPPRRQPAAPGPLACLACLACVVAAAFAVFDGQYLSWSYIGAAQVQGVQGRYFLPLIPFLALALPSVAVPGGAALRQALRAPLILACAAGLVIIPELVVTTYYLR